MICSKCGVEITDDKKFCGNCGHVVFDEPVSKTPSTSSQTCENCGSQITNNKKFCGDCGVAQVL